MQTTCFQAFENNEEMKLKARMASSEETSEPVVDKVCGVALALNDPLLRDKHPFYSINLSTCLFLSG